MREFSEEEQGAFLMYTAERTDLDLWTKSVVDMSGPRQTFVLIWELEAEVNNGGFKQYFHNSSGEGAGLCVAALNAIKADATAGLVAQAIKIFGKDTSWHDDDERQARANAFDTTESDALDALDQAFFQYADNLTALLFAYVVGHIADFRPPSA